MGIADGRQAPPERRGAASTVGLVGKERCDGRGQGGQSADLPLQAPFLENSIIGPVGVQGSRRGRSPGKPGSRCNFIGQN